MIHTALILLMSVSYAVSEHCVTYTFEQNYEEWLTHEWRNINCHKPFWIEDKYSNIDLSAENDQSTIFIRPTPDVVSCVSSFNFTMHYNGKIEVNFYLEEGGFWNFIEVFAETTEGSFLGGVYYDANFKSGWQTLTIPLNREDSYEGYISIHGRASSNSTVLVDSFRYIPPNIDEDDCRLYEEEITTIQSFQKRPKTKL